MPEIRAFIALQSSPEIKTKLTEVQSELISANADVKWDATEKFHITLKFLGNCKPEVLAQLTTDLRSSLQDIHSFEIVYRTIGSFPTIAHPKVVWVGADKNQSLDQLQTKVEEVCTKLGFAKEDRQFHPHITLGRVKGNRNIHRLTEKLKSITLEPLQAQCSEVMLMRSELKPTGSIYTLLNSIPLKS